MKTQEGVRESYYRSGKIKLRTWKFQGKTHRAGAPAQISYYETGKVRTECWIRRGKFHRADGPAYVKYSSTGEVLIEDWYLEGKRHRVDGPALTDNRKNRHREYWCLHGVGISQAKHGELLAASELSMLVHLYREQPKRHLLAMIRKIDKRVARNVQAGVNIE